jgi:hypothetical protein
MPLISPQAPAFDLALDPAVAPVRLTSALVCGQKAFALAFFLNLRLNNNIQKAKKLKTVISVGSIY